MIAGKADDETRTKGNGRLADQTSTQTVKLLHRRRLAEIHKTMSLTHLHRAKKHHLRKAADIPFHIIEATQSWAS
jgi:hypothetical protein